MDLYLGLVFSWVCSAVWGPGGQWEHPSPYSCLFGNIKDWLLDVKAGIPHGSGCALACLASRSCPSQMLLFLLHQEHVEHRHAPTQPQSSCPAGCSLIRFQFYMHLAEPVLFLLVSPSPHHHKAQNFVLSYPGILCPIHCLPKQFLSFPISLGMGFVKCPEHWFVLQNIM